MDPAQLSLVPDLQSRIREHFEKEGSEEIVRQSQSLITFPDREIDGELVPILTQGSVLAHPRPRPVPLNAYLASALTGLEPTQKSLIIHLSDMVNLVCRSVDIDLYEPRKKTDPVHNAQVTSSEVFRIDRERVVGSDVLIHLCHFPSTGSGEELSFAYDALVPIVLIIHGDQNVSRMITGIPGLKIEIRYNEPEEMREMLEERLREIRPLLEQRRLAKEEFSENVVGAKVKELRLEAGLSKEQLATLVGLDPDGISEIEENVDTVSNPSLTKLRLIATALKTTVAELVNPDYTESVLAGIQSMLDDRALETAAARFKGVSRRDQKALMERFLVRFLYLLKERGR
jgi:transcriptional regulator with XRE-family HTH domain